MFPDLETSPASTGLWPTPTGSDSKASGAAGYSTASGRHSGTTLTDAVVRGVSRGLTSSPEASRVSRLASPDDDGAWTTTAGYGPSSPVSLASYDPDSSSWRTY